MHTNGAAEGSPPLTAEQIFRSYGARIYTLARRILGNEADAEDVTQDVLVQVLSKLHTFRGESALSTWLYRVAVNAALAYRRKQRPGQEHYERDPTEGLEQGGPAPVRPWTVDPETKALSEETRSLIEQAIARLPEMYRTVYVLADVEGLSNAEIGTILGLGVPAVKSRLHRARLLMRRALAPHFEEALA